MKNLEDDPQAPPQKKVGSYANESNDRSRRHDPDDQDPDEKVEQFTGFICLAIYGVLGLCAGVALGWSLLSQFFLGFVGMGVGSLAGFTIAHVWLDNLTENIRLGFYITAIFNLCFLIACAIGITYVGNALHENLMLWIVTGISTAPFITWGVFELFDHLESEYL